ncbi:MAG TPA: nuclear transport factor 2 family protein [Vicinamibacterales bacterium]|nr:nuclear transport factor 2 family protein [Vicinamibacterales bacterium]
MGATRIRDWGRRGIAAALTLIGATAAASPCTIDAPVRDAELALATARAHDDRAAIADLLAPDYTGVDVFGQIHERDTRTSASATPSVCESVHTHGPVTVIVAHENDTRVLRVWVERKGRWQVAAEQRVVIQPGRTDPDGAWTLGDVRDAPSPDSPSTVREVLRAQDALDRANAMRDPSTFARLTDVDFVVITSHGLVRSKTDRVIEERVARLEAQPERPVPRRDDVRVRLFGASAIITARNWPRTFEGVPRPPTRYTRVWVKNAAGWQQVANVSTIIRPTAP